MTTIPDFGVLVISLDFELHWGRRDRVSITGPYRNNFLGVRKAIPKMLDLFGGFDIAATWATVGFLFAASRKELESYSPWPKPSYHNPTLSPYGEPVGDGEQDDPFHYAPSLVQLILKTPRQEIGSHTFSHYYCLEQGQDRETFEADLQSAVAIARKYGVHLRSIVFPRNQHNPAYDDILIGHGIECYRASADGWMYRSSVANDGAAKRAARLIDSHLNVSGLQTTKWHHTYDGTELYRIPGSYFLRPYSPRWRHLEWLRLRRIAEAIRHAAISKEIVHLWWHPHNFGIHINENIRLLESILRSFALCRSSYGMQSMSMGDVATIMRLLSQKCLVI